MMSNAESLRISIRNYNIGFNMQLAQVDISGKMVWVKFYLELSGDHDYSELCTADRCSVCEMVLRTLFEVLDALWPLDRETFARVGYDCEKRLHYARLKGEHQVVLGLDIIVGRSFARAEEGWALRFMEQVSTPLMDLGCRRRPVPHAPESLSNQCVANGDARASLQENEWFYPRDVLPNFCAVFRS